MKQGQHNSNHPQLAHSIIWTHSPEPSLVSDIRRGKTVTSFLWGSNSISLVGDGLLVWAKQETWDSHEMPAGSCCLVAHVSTYLTPPEMCCALTCIEERCWMECWMERICINLFNITCTFQVYGGFWMILSAILIIPLNQKRENLTVVGPDKGPANNVMKHYLSDASIIRSRNMCRMQYICIALMLFVFSLTRNDFLRSIYAKACQGE